MVALAVNPHFAIPFRLRGASGAVVTEQDTEEEILDCVETIVRYNVGHRPEKPDFGIPDPTFSHPSPDIGKIRDSVNTWEPRLTMDIGEVVIDKIDPLVQSIRIEEERPPNE